MPGPPSSTASSTRSAGAAHRHGVRRALRGVGEDVAEQHVDGGGARPRAAGAQGAGRRARCGTSHDRPSSSASAPQNAARSSTTSARSLRTAISSCSGRRAARISSLTSASRRSTSSMSVGGAVALGVEAEGGERGAQPVGQVGDPLALGDAQLVDAVGEEVERLGDVGDLRRTGDVGAGVVSPPASARLVRARSAAGRVTLRASRSVASDRHDQQHQRRRAPAPATRSPRHRWRARRARGRAARPPRRCRARPGCTRRCRRRPTPRRRRCCSRASATESASSCGLVTDLGAVGEEHREAVVLARRRALDRGVELVGVGVDGEDRASAAWSASASVMARSRATSRTRSASGMANAATSSVVTARVTRKRRRRIAGAALRRRVARA